MTIANMLSIIFLLLLAFFAILYQLRKNEPPVRIDFIDTGDEEKAVYGLQRTPLSTAEAECVCICGAGFAMLACSLHILLAVYVVILVISSISDFRNHAISVIDLLCLFLTGCAIGVRAGSCAVVVLCTIIFCAYEVFVTDNDSFGGGDVYALLACFAALGMFAGIIATIISCVVGILMKLALWAFKIDEKENRGIPFVPAISVGTVAGYILKTVFADMLQYINIENLIWFFRSLKGA